MIGTKGHDEVQPCRNGVPHDGWETFTIAPGSLRNGPIAGDSILKGLYRYFICALNVSWKKSKKSVFSLKHALSQNGTRRDVLQQGETL